MARRLVLSLLALLALSAPVLEASAAPPRAATAQGAVTFTAKVTSVDLSRGVVTAVDQDGKTWQLTVAPGSGIDLRRVKVGDTYTFTARIASAALRARMSKAELIRLQ